MNKNFDENKLKNNACEIILQQKAWWGQKAYFLRSVV